MEKISKSVHVMIFKNNIMILIYLSCFRCQVYKKFSSNNADLIVLVIMPYLSLLMSIPERRCWMRRSTLLWSVGVKLSIHLYFPSSGRHRVAHWTKKESEYSGDGDITCWERIKLDMRYTYNTLSNFLSRCNVWIIKKLHNYYL